MFLTFRRLLIMIGCLLYTGACVTVAESIAGQEEKWALWAIALAHVIFGAEALLLCCWDHSKREIKQLRAEQTADRREVAELRGLVTKLNSQVESLQKERGGGNDAGKPLHKEMVD
jgi:Na+/melibiose symporter-like transporter